MAFAFAAKIPTVKKLLDVYAANGASVDIQAIFFKFTLDSICDIAFGRGKEMNTLEVDHPFGNAFDQANAICSRRFFVPSWLWKVKKLLNIGEENELRKHCSVIESFVNTIVTGRMADGAESQQEGDLLSLFIEDNKKKNQEITPKELRDVVMNFIIAGRDTTAWAMTATIMLLCQHPEVADKAYAEVQDILGSSQSDSAADHQTTKDMPFLRAVISEALRLWPSVPSDVKQCLKDDELPSGVQVPAGCFVSYPIYSLSRRKDIWGEDAAEFKPERWLAGDTEREPFTEYKYPVFNAGLRICLGREMAYLECGILLSELLRRYKFSLAEHSAKWTAQKPPQPVEFLVGATLSFENGLMCKLTPR